MTGNVHSCRESYTLNKKSKALLGSFSHRQNVRALGYSIKGIRSALLNISFYKTDRLIV